MTIKTTEEIINKHIKGCIGLDKKHNILWSPVAEQIEWLKMNKTHIEKILNVQPEESKGNIGMLKAQLIMYGLRIKELEEAQE